MTKLPLNEGSTPVSFDTAQKQTTDYRDFIGTVGISEIAFFIKREDIISVLQLPESTPVNPDISGMRMYMALQDLPDGKKRSHVYVVATDQKLNDITMDSNKSSLIYDMTWPCPNLCSNPNVLNTDASKTV
jgi:hypothetical protein